MLYEVITPAIHSAWTEVSMIFSWGMACCILSVHPSSNPILPIRNQASEADRSFICEGISEYNSGLAPGGTSTCTCTRSPAIFSTMYFCGRMLTETIGVSGLGLGLHPKPIKRMNRAILFMDFRILKIDVQR